MLAAAGYDHSFDIKRVLRKLEIHKNDNNELKRIHREIEEVSDHHDVEMFSISNGLIEILPVNLFIDGARSYRWIRFAKRSGYENVQEDATYEKLEECQNDYDVDPVHDSVGQTKYLDGGISRKTDVLLAVAFPKVVLSGPKLQLHISLLIIKLFAIVENIILESF